MSVFEDEIKAYHEGIEKLKILEPNLISLNESAPNKSIGLLSEYLQEITKLSNLNTEISKQITDLDIANDELHSLKLTKQSLDQELLNLQNLPLPVAIQPDPHPSSPNPLYTQKTESIQTLKTKISQLESEINLLKVNHPLNLTQLKLKYSSELQKQKNNLRQEKFFNILTKLTLSHEASVHSFITREELQEGLSKISESNRVYTEQIKKAAIISIPKPTILSYPVTQAPNTLQTILLCLIFFFIPPLLSKFILLNNNQKY